MSKAPDNASGAVKRIRRALKTWKGSEGVICDQADVLELLDASRLLARKDAELQRLRQALRLARPHVEAHRDYCLGKHGVVGKMDQILTEIDAALNP